MKADLAPIFISKMEDNVTSGQKIREIIGLFAWLVKCLKQFQTGKF